MRFPTPQALSAPPQDWRGFFVDFIPAASFLQMPPWRLAVHPRLEEHFTVARMDRRGRGGSGDGSGDSTEYAIEHEFEDLATIVNALETTDGLDASTHLSDLDYTQSMDALIAGEIDVAIVPQLNGSPLQRLLDAPEIRLMNVAQAEAIAKTVPGLKHVVLWRGLISLSRDIPNLAGRNSGRCVY
jgi:hypothetical protein